MKWKLCFEVNGKTYNAKRKEFESFKEVLNYSKEFSENYIYGKKEKIVAKINSEDGIKYYKYIYHPDGEFETYFRDLSGKIKKENEEKLCRGTNKPRDFQRKKVYDWEERVFSKYGFFVSKMKPEEVKDFIKDIINGENLPPLKVILKKGHGSCFFKYSLDESFKPTLTFRQQWGLNKFVICHELAHYICHVKKINEGGHSENFVGIYIYLLSKYIKIKEEQLWDSAKRHGLKLIKYSKKHFESLIEK